MAKTITIPTDKVQAWLKNFFQTIDMYEIIALACMGVGFVLVILGAIML